MSMATLSYVADKVEGRLVGADNSFDGVSTDTRHLTAGELFVALKGPHFDGNEYVVQAQERGAAGAMVEAVHRCALSQIHVRDTRAALGRFAKAWRSQFDIPVIGITGSNGKTTVKEMVARILEGLGRTLSTRGNLNNDIGVPLTLLRLRQTYRYAVIEMGANHRGEIAYLTGLAKPGVGIVTNAAFAHLEGFGSALGVAEAKGELFAGLGPQATSVINADDEYADKWRGLASHTRIVTFGLDQQADFYASSIRQTAGSQPSLGFELHSPDGTQRVRLNMVGRHNVMNALAAAAAAWAIGADLKAVSQGLAAVTNVEGRLRIKEGLRKTRIVDDTYNANPGSVRAALEFLAELEGPAWLVLGDMGELGPQGPALHTDIGNWARDLGVERLYAVGELSRFTADSFGSGSHWFDDRQSLITELVKALRPGVNVLVKASRSMGMEHVVSALCSGDERAGG